MHRLIAAAVTATVLGVGLLVLQRWVAQTRDVAILLVGAWFAVVGLGALVVVRRRPDLRLPVLGTFAAIVVASAAIGYWTGFRDKEVDENVVMASRDATPVERDEGLVAQEAEPTARRKPPSGPIRLASGAIAGADGHTASGRAAIVRSPDGDRRLTLTDFEADPGPQVVVYLARDEGNVDDVISLGGLKGNVGRQQYRIPDDANLRRHDTLILWCVPFTTRIAVAALR